MTGWEVDDSPDDPDATEGAAADVDRAPICPYCGVTALPSDPTPVLDPQFVCENADCEAFGEAV